MKFVSIAKNVSVRTAVIAALISSALTAGATEASVDAAQRSLAEGYREATPVADSKTTVTRNADGSVTTCRYETDFVTVQGSTMIRTAWRCETVKGNR